ncbi:hypothetical protein G3M53_68660 [Streptomyces sp. SID7982]|nr:hypothetical protein [Streptomyces sp. SID7982]
MNSLGMHPSSAVPWSDRGCSRERKAEGGVQQIGPRVGMRLIHMTHTEHRGSATYHYYRIQTAH